MHAAVAAAGITATVTAEPGRALVAQAAVTLYTVGTIKDLPGIRTYVAVDGGMSDNPRPVLYGSGYEAFLPRAVTADRTRTVTVVGKHCESGDVLVRDARVPADLAVGDVLATPVTGAYGHSMGSGYNKVTRPAVVFVADGDARLVVRREIARRPPLPRPRLTAGALDGGCPGGAGRGRRVHVGRHPEHHGVRLRPPGGAVDGDRDPGGGGGRARRRVLDCSRRSTQAITQRAHAVRPVAGRMLLGALVGAPLGLAILTVTTGRQLRFFLAGVIFVFLR